MSTLCITSFVHHGALGSKYRQKELYRLTNTQTTEHRQKELYRLYKHTNNLLSAIKDEMKPIFKDLAKTELLQKCLAGYIQNEK